jgi:hypothetical protein
MLRDKSILTCPEISITGLLSGILSFFEPDAKVYLFNFQTCTAFRVADYKDPRHTGRVLFHSFFRARQMDRQSHHSENLNFKYVKIDS